MAPQPSSLRTSFRALCITRIEIKESVIYGVGRQVFTGWEVTTKELATESPLGSTHPFAARLPVAHSGVMDTDNFTHALCLCTKGSVAQETADKLSSFVKVDIEKYQAISPVAQISLVKIVIAGKEGRSGQSMQEGNNLTAIFHPRSSDLSTNMSRMHLPRSEQLALRSDDVLVKDIHAACRGLSVFLISALEAKAIASAMAS
jgi:hypothetical protein